MKWIPTLLAGVMAWGTVVSARPLNKVKRDILTVAIRPGPLPFGVVAKGTDKGFDYDLVAAIAEGIGVHFRTVEVESLVEAQDLLSRDKVDLVIGGVRATPRLRETAFLSGPYYTTGLGILTLRANQNLYTLSDLEGRPVAATPESGADKLLESFLSKSKLEMVRTIKDGVELLQRGDVEAVLGDQATLAALEQKAQSFRLLDVSLTQDEFVLLTSRNSASLLDAVDEQLRRFRTASSEQDMTTLGALCAKYGLSETVSKIIRPGATAPGVPAASLPKPVSNPVAAPAGGSGSLESRVLELERTVRDLQRRLDAAKIR
ncbi:MAG: transporter substrate-binding domain-containing protein [Fibrobacteria bacterium]|nr:transporter substrate-binding domain-containing protein [Fibrobacteria bacterium]